MLLSQKYILILLLILTNGRTLMIPFLSLYQITTKYLMTMTDTLTKLISVTPDAEKHMAYCARVSNPNNQENEKFSGLLKYCVKHQHWSIFEQAYMTLEINTTRGIAAQVLRTVRSHIKNFHNAMLILPYSRRRSLYLNYGVKTPRIVRILLMILTRLSVKSSKSKCKHFEEGMKLYKEMLDAELQRSVLVLCFPLATAHKNLHDGFSKVMDSLYRFAFCKWYTEGAHGYCFGCKEIFCEQFPAVAEAMEWI